MPMPAGEPRHADTPIADAPTAWMARGARSARSVTVFVATFLTSRWLSNRSGVGRIASRKPRAARPTARAPGTRRAAAATQAPWRRQKAAEPSATQTAPTSAVASAVAVDAAGPRSADA